MIYNMNGARYYRRRKFTKPRKIMPAYQLEIDNVVEMLLDEAGITLPEGWNFYVTDTTCGRCWPGRKFLSVPLWAYRKGVDYFIYYVAHELAHTIANTRTHGPEFMEAFKRICPPHLWHFELDYKPQFAAAAGIRRGPGDLSVFQLKGDPK
jgi:hypothetical protein